MCNIGAKKAKGEYYLLLNDDIEIIESEWLERMLGQAQLKHTGAVGAKLYYPNSKIIQHDGVIFIKQGPVHCLSGYSDDNTYYFGRNRLDYNYSAVTAACLLVSADKYKEVGGLNESLAVAYNDIDFCLKLVEKGYYNVIRNDAILYHHESVSRGSDVDNSNKFTRLINEQVKLFQMHPEYENNDPCYNPNLTQINPDFSYNIEKIGIIKDNIKVFNANVIEKNNNKFDINNNLKINIDSKILKISGWLFRENKKYENIRKTHIILKGQNKNYIFGTDKEYIESLSDLSKDNGKYNLCAFNASIERKKIDSGKYSIFLEKGNMVMDPHQVIEIK